MNGLKNRTNKPTGFLVNEKEASSILSRLKVNSSKTSPLRMDTGRRKDTQKSRFTNPEDSSFTRTKAAPTRNSSSLESSHSKTHINDYFNSQKKKDRATKVHFNTHVEIREIDSNRTSVHMTEEEYRDQRLKKREEQPKEAIKTLIEIFDFKL